MQFPRILLPISTVNGQTVAFMPALALVMAAVLLTGERPAMRWLALTAVMAAQFSFNLGAAFVIARIGAAMRDTRELLPHLFRLLFYGSGVIFSVDAFVDSPAWRMAFTVNPLYDLITCARWCLLGTPVALHVVLATVVWSISLPVAGFVLFRRSELRFGA